MNTRRHRFASRPMLEGLEGRRLQAGNVTASIVNGDLRIIGDNLSNQVVVIEDAGRYRVRGLNNTKINSAAADLFFSQEQLTRDLRVDMKGGNDIFLLVLNGIQVPRDVKVSGGDGNDTVGFDQVNVGNDLTIDMGRGNDVVNLENTLVGDDMTIDTGADRDRVRLANVQVQDRLDIDLGSGNADLLQLEQVSATRARLRGGSGNADELRRTDVTIDDLQFNGFEELS